MVPDSPDVEVVAIGKDGIIDAAYPGLIYVDMSTIAPRISIKVAEVLGEMGVRCLDSPVSGGQVGAQNATLSIMVGGPKDLFEEMKPLFEVMGKTITHCGDHGAGQIVKASNRDAGSTQLYRYGRSACFGDKSRSRARGHSYGIEWRICPDAGYGCAEGHRLLMAILSLVSRASSTTKV